MWFGTALAAAAMALAMGAAPARAQSPEPAPDGRVERVSIPSKALAAERGATVYLPPGWTAGGSYPVVYMADGQAAGAVLKILDPMIREGRLPPLILVGLHAAPDGNQRHREYLPDFTRPGAPDFDVHMRFFVNEVMPAVEKRYGASTRPTERLLLGFSDGAAWAIATSLRRPRDFPRVAAFSLGWAQVGLPSEAGARPKFFLGYGTDEGPFRFQTQNFASAARSSGYDVRLSVRKGRHGQALWEPMYADALTWAFGKG